MIQEHCYHFRGDRPCAPHKESGYSCNEQCPAKLTGHFRRWCIIQLGAMGDVMRTTPLLRAIHSTDWGAHVTWVTRYPDLLPDAPIVARKLTPAEAQLVLQVERFDVLVNLDKEATACLLASIATAEVKRGFIWHYAYGRPTVAVDKWNTLDPLARDKFLTGIDDRLSKANRKSYVEEALNIAGFQWTGQRYWLPQWEQPQGLALGALPRPAIGLAVGCGARWSTRSPGDLWWRRFVEALRGQGYRDGIVLLGGPDDVRRLAHLEVVIRDDVIAIKPLPLRQYMGFVGLLSAVVTPVSLALHVGIGMGVPVVALNNIFNPAEFEMYGRGEVVAPSPGCQCYYASTCQVGRHCANEYDPDAVARIAIEWASGKVGVDAV